MNLNVLTNSMDLKIVNILKRNNLMIYKSKYINTAFL